MLEENTTDAQVSNSIANSKKDNLFLGEYKQVVDTTGRPVISAAWAEYIWFNEIKHLRTIKRKISTPQLVLCPDSNFLRRFKYDSYLMGWKMKDEQSGKYFGSQSGTYSLSLSDTDLPDSILISIVSGGVDY
jgi:hypothetical protein